MDYTALTDEELEQHTKLKVNQVKAGISLSAVEDELSKIEDEQNRRNEHFKHRTLYNEDGSVKQTQRTNMKTTIAEVVDYEGGKPVHSASFNVNGDVVRTATFHENGSLHTESYYKDHKNTQNYEYDEKGKTLKSDHAVENTDQREHVQYADNKPIGAVVFDSEGQKVRSSNFTTDGQLREVKEFDGAGNVTRTQEYENGRLAFDSNDVNELEAIGDFEWIDVQNRNGENAKYLDIGQFENDEQATKLYEALENAGIEYENKATSLAGSSGQVISVTDPKAIDIINSYMGAENQISPDIAPVAQKPTNNVKMGM